MNLDNLQFNKYQTRLTEDLLNELPKEVKEQLLELINRIYFCCWKTKLNLIVC